MSSVETELEREFGVALGRLGPALLAALTALEAVFRHLHPPDLPRLRARLEPVREALREASHHFESTPGPESAASFRRSLDAATDLALSALAHLIEPAVEGVGGVGSTMGVLQAMHEHARAQAQLYPLRTALPPVSAYFAEPFAQQDLGALEAVSGAPAAAGEAEKAATSDSPSASAPAMRVGLFRSGEPNARGGFDLYVPEHYDGREAWPLVVALHGGSGNGADFLWSWLREARSRGVLLVAPTSRDTTWSLAAPEIDGAALRQMTEWIASNWHVDRTRVLLTGLSDGATMTLLVGLGEAAPYTHLAPISGVLHPLNFAIRNMERAAGKPIYLVHGALDWMFPVALAREAARAIENAGGELVYREIADLSHTYPRDENARILDWFGVRGAVATGED